MNVRPVAALELDIERLPAMGQPPRLVLAAPTSLYLDANYQRGLSERSMRLIGRIVAGWDWRAYKPPCCIEVDGARHIVDGQHTAIAAATHGGLGDIPILVHSEASLEARAHAFVRHNRDRVPVSPLAVHNALATAGDEDAVTLEQVCARAGVTVLRTMPARLAPGQTIALAAIRGLIARRHPLGARRVLSVLVAAGAPVDAGFIRAVEVLLFAEEFTGEIAAEDIAAILAAGRETILSQAKRLSADQGHALGYAIALTIWRHHG